jgi:cellulose synthase/poly-beta-1,6-N-acetylglucosamine synthase-like glycosyltransferase
MIGLEIILFISLFCMLHSYIFYPELLKRLKKGRFNDISSYSHSDALPYVSILMAAYNEEAVIEKKIHSIFKNDYPLKKLEILIGSDNSSDKTNEIVKRMESMYDNLHFTVFTQRQGKISIINQLKTRAKGEILLLTDANVIFQNETIFELIKTFKDERIGLVDTRMVNTGLKKEGISMQEKSYISREVLIKNKEGKLWGSMMGPFGGCYAIRKNLFIDVPLNYLVDDFFICMKVLQQKKACINNLEAIVFEDVSNNLQDEFWRKVRIATGNFQNLLHFKSMLFPLWNPVAFSFWSHKALRWIGPFFLVAIYISLIILSTKSLAYLILLILALISISLPLYDILLKKIGIHNLILRFATHFFTMNLALFVGFLRFTKGVKTNVWKPTKRFQ